jgi:hypothetical protein
MVDVVHLRPSIHSPLPGTFCTPGSCAPSNDYKDVDTLNDDDDACAKSSLARPPRPPSLLPQGLATRWREQKTTMKRHSIFLAWQGDIPYLSHWAHCCPHCCSRCHPCCCPCHHCLLLLISQASMGAGTIKGTLLTSFIPRFCNGRASLPAIKGIILPPTS